MSAVKERLVLFLEATREQPTYTFKLRGSIDDGQKFVQCMRVQLSRWRSALKRKNMCAKYFKMILQSIDISEEDESVVEITLFKRTSLIDLQDGLSEVIGDLALKKENVQ